LFLYWLADDCHNEPCHGAIDAFDLIGANVVILAHAQDRTNVRVNYMRRGKRLERRVAALPMRAELLIDAREIAMRTRVLHVRREQSPASLKTLRRPSRPRASQDRRCDAALCRPPRMQELGLRPVHPAFEQPRSEAPRNPRRSRHGVGVEPK